ncbi:MAG: class II glutamine amidotransferase [Candidatus Cloacimonetes bacterium]|nr:class II glutamine amidotransferase [Candidatus Cloacimonadota bacterium]
MKKIFIAIIVLTMIYSANLHACRLLGVLARDGKEFQDTGSGTQVAGAFTTLRGQSSTNPHGWGQVFYKPDSRTYDYLARSSNTASQDGSWGNYDSYSTSLALAHVRYATTGATDVDDPHPFIFHDELRRIDYSFIHHGTVGKDRVKNLIELHDDELGYSWLNVHQPNTYGNGSYTTPGGWANVVDSEIYFLWIMLNIELKSHNVIEGLRQALCDMGSCSSGENYNFIFTDGEDLYAYRYGDDDNHPLYYGFKDMHGVGVGGYGLCYWLVMTEMSDTYNENNESAMYQKFPLENNELVYLPKYGREVLFKNFRESQVSHIRRLHPGFNWEGFPVLSDNALASYNLSPLTGYEVSNINGVGGYNAVYDDDWDPYNYALNDDNFFKINMGQQTPHITQDYAFGVTGSMRNPDEEIIDGPIYTHTKYWINYSILPSQSPRTAFGDLWRKVDKIEAEDWVYINPGAHYKGRGIEDAVQYPSSQVRPLEFGKGYIVTFRYSHEDDFVWKYPTEAVREVRRVNAAPEYFNPEKKASYDVIDVIDIPQEVTEIGVFQNGICVGAVKVEQPGEQILVYTDDSSKDESIFEIELVTDNSRSAISTSYQIYDFKTDEYYSEPLVAGKANYSIIRLDKAEYGENNVVSNVSIIGNYPNPFNPSTTISYYSSNSENVKIDIFNLKGQKVKEIFNGISAVGNNKVVWNGTDETGRNASSGVYLYKISTATESVQAKMLLLK